MTPVARLSRFSASKIPTDAMSGIGDEVCGPVARSDCCAAWVSRTLSKHVFFGSMSETQAQPKNLQYLVFEFETQAGTVQRGIEDNTLN